MRIIEGRALILSGADSRDDKIVRLLMEDDELVPVLVKHGRRSSGRSSKAGSIQPLTAVRVIVRAKPAGDLAVLEQVAMEASYAFVKGDLLRLALATCMTEVVLHLCPDWGREAGLYLLLARALDGLERADARPGEDWLWLFELRALAAAGVLPPIDEWAEVPREGRETLQAWLEGRWLPLDAISARVIGPLLEGALTSASGRVFRSRALLSEALR